MSERDTPVATPFVQRVEDFKRRTLPLIVWSLATIVVITMLVGRARRFEYIGLAQGMEYEISAGSTGTVDTVVVGLYDPVDAGDVVAKLDDSTLRATIETVNATIRRLQAELDAARVELLSARGQDLADWTADLRRFQIDEEQRRLDILELKVVIESDQIDLERLGLDFERAGQLLRAGFITQSEFDTIRLEREQIDKRVGENRLLLAQTEQEYRTARARRETYESKLPTPAQEEPVLQPLRAAIEEENLRLREIDLQRESLVLRSPVVGQVSQILCSKGQTVVPGEPILTIAERSVQEIVAYLSEPEGSTVTPNTPVLVSSRTRPEELAESVILNVGPTIQTLPRQLWRDPRIEEYGRAVVIAAVPGMALTPGEVVQVKLLSRESSPKLP